MNKIKITLKEDGSVEQFTPDFKIMRGSYRNVLINIEVPYSLLLNPVTDLDDNSNQTGNNVRIGAIIRTATGQNLQTQRYEFQRVKDYTNNGIAYRLYQRRMPKEFTMWETVNLLEATNSGVLEMVINVTNWVMNGTIAKIEEVAASPIFELSIYPSAFLENAEEIDDSSDFDELQSQVQEIDAELEGQLDALDARLVDVEVEAAKVDNKVDKVEGKGLSTEDYTTVEKTKVSSMPMFYTSLSDISGVDVTTVTPIALGWAMADNSILTAEIDPEINIGLCPDIVNVTTPGNIYVCKGDEKVTLKYTVLQNGNVLTYDGVADLDIISPVWSGWTYSNRTGEYDVIIRTQDEFNDLRSSPTWNDVRTVAISGSFTGGGGITIPSNVVKIDGIGRAVLNFHIDTEIEDTSVLFGYEELPLLPFNPISALLYSMSGITIEYTGKVLYNYQTIGFQNIRNISNCFAFSSTEGQLIGHYGGKFIGFDNCIGGGNLYVEGTCYIGDGYRNCENMTNIGGDIRGKGDLIHPNPALGLYFCADDTPSTNLLRGCKNIHGVSGEAKVSVDAIFTNTFNISSILWECNNISGISAVARGGGERDCAYGIVDCHHITNFDIKAETLGEYSSAIGVLRSSRISTGKAEAEAINSTHFEKAAYEYYYVSYASSCSPVIPLEHPYVGSTEYPHGDRTGTIDPSAGGEYQIKKPDGVNNLIHYGKIHSNYLPEITNTDAVTGVKGDAEESYRIGNVNITPANIGLGNVDNTSDADKPVSTAQQAAIDTAVDALYGTSGAVTLLSTNWSESTYTLTVAALGTDDAIFITPSTSADKTLIEAANFFVSASGTTVTITAETVPTVDIDIDYFISRGKANE